MSSVSVNPPKTPVTKGSNGIATATIPNVCKMPGPPAPFVPAPLPNIGKSGMSPKDYSQDVTIEGKAVAIKGSTFESMGDIASKGTGGGLISANTHGITKFVGPGSMDVKIEGKNVQLLSDPMLNNCAAGGSPPNAATVLGVIQMSGMVTAVEARVCPVCGKTHGELAEDAKTKADAGSLASNFDGKVKPVIAKYPEAWEHGIKTMLGVVHCRCGSAQKYADQSAMTTKELCEAASASGMKHPKNVTVSYEEKAKLDPEYLATLDRVKEGIKNHLGDSAVFRAAWQEGSDRAARSDAARKKKENKKKKIATAYPPGTCAAQKALLALMDDGGLAKAMTEEYYSSVGGQTQAAIEHIDLRKGTRDPQIEKFNHGDTVPPCKTCEVIVPLLLCDDGKTKCH